MRLPGFVLILLVSGCDLPAQPTSRDAGRLQDLNFISNQLPQLHPNFFFQLNPSDYAAAVQALQAQIPNLTDAQFYDGLAALVALAGDAHTALPLNSSAAASVGFQDFPLLFRWLDDGVYVTAASAPYSRAVGTQLVAASGLDIDAVIAKLATVISHANLQWVHKVAQDYLSGQQILQGLGVLPSTPTSQLTFRDLSGQEFTLDVSPGGQPTVTAPAITVGPLPPYLQNTNQNYWFTYVSSLRLLYFKYNRCQDDPNNPFAAFAANLLSVYDANPVDTLVFDFRDNGGGNAGVIVPLLNGFGQRLLSALSGGGVNPKLRVFDVIDKGTFSSAMDNAVTLKEQALQAAAVFPGVDQLLTVIGEPTGGKPEEYGNVLPFTLPFSRLTGQYSTQFFSQPAGIPPGPYFAPDVAVAVRSTDYFARHDPVLAAALARYAGAPPAPTGNAIAVNAASFHSDQGLAPGSFASVFGAFASGVDQVLVNGQASHIFAAFASQVNFVVPSGVSPGPASIDVRAAGQEVAKGQATITLAGPGLFVLNATDPSQPGAVENQDFSVNGTANRAASGSILQIFGTGYGPLDTNGQAGAQVVIGGALADVFYSGPAPGLMGLWQVNARAPAGITGQVPLFVIAGDIASNAVTIWLE